MVKFIVRKYRKLQFDYKLSFLALRLYHVLISGFVIFSKIFGFYP